MAFKVCLAALFLAGVLASPSAADPKHPKNKDWQDTSKASTKTVAVPEPSVLLLASLGMGSVLAGSWYVRRQKGQRSR